MQNKNKTVVKAMDLLTFFLTHPTLTLKQLVDLSGKPKTSVHRMVGSLEEMGILQKDAEGRYRLGLLLLQLGQLVYDRLDICQIALPTMDELRNEVGEAVNLIMKDGQDALYVEKLDTPHPVRLYTKKGRRAPLYAGACSRIILSFLPEEERAAYMNHVELIPIASGTITDKAQLASLVASSREHYYTISFSELEKGTVSVAAPILDHLGNMVAGLSVAGPESRFQSEKLGNLINKTRDAAEHISRLLGYQESFPQSMDTSGI
ncbi:IclR family transcriptional regulator [Brevibacillus daliensis]|uniref:IclR family transcriptional regulator n=1 Tax=Brevibacillus daliensis TaxID=2892995 RepID=UPI001E44D4B6|nr:IclR family transcriptional regulator [Brevibacillus daliensis]